MAYIRKRGKTWQAIVRVKGADPVTATLPTKAQAQHWAQAEEAAIRAGKRGQYPVKTLAQALDRYAEEISQAKTSGAQEIKRFTAFKRDFPALASAQFSALTASDLIKWRDARLKQVTPGSVQRDINLLRHVWTIGRKEWGWCGDSPWSNLRMPGNNRPREAVWSWQQVRRVLRQMHYRTGLVPVSAMHDVAYIFLIALSTGMRAGEIVNLKASDVDLERRVIRLDHHKTVKVAGARRVPFTARAGRLLAIPLASAEGDRLWRVSSNSLDTLFRRYRDAAGVSGLTFHDARATFATLTARKTDPLTLAKILGHRDMGQLIKTYYRESAEDIAKRL